MKLTIEQINEVFKLLGDEEDIVEFTGFWEEFRPRTNSYNLNIIRITQVDDDEFSFSYNKGDSEYLTREEIVNYNFSENTKFNIIITKTIII